MLLIKYRSYGTTYWDWSEDDEIFVEPVCELHLPDRSKVDVRWVNETLRKPRNYLETPCSSCGTIDIGLIDVYQCCVCEDYIICYRCYRNGYHTLVHPFTTYEIDDTYHWAINLRVRRGAKQELFRILRNHGNSESNLVFPTHKIKIDKGTKRKRKSSPLIAMLFGDVEFVKEFIEKGETLDTADREGDTLLHYAVFGNHTEIIRLLAKNPYINKRNVHGQTPLHCAARYSSPECVKILLAAKAKHTCTDGKGNTALHCAAIGSHNENLKMLIVAGADLEASNDRGCTALHLAAIHQAVPAAKILLEAGANPNCKRHLESTPLHEAAQNPSEILELLVKGGCEVNASNREGSTALHVLAKSSVNVKHVKKLLRAGADPNMRECSGYTALHKAAETGPANLKTLVKAGTKVNAVDVRGRTALHCAVQEESEMSIQILLTTGIDANIKNFNGYTALQEAAKSADGSILRLLLEGGVDPNTKDSRGNTALHVAVQENRIEIVQILCSSRKMDTSVTNDRGFNALHEAARLGHAAATARILQRSPELVDLRSMQNGKAPLHMSTAYSDVLKFLLRLGKANINLKTTNGKTALHIAVSETHQAAVEILVSNKADVNVTDADGNSSLHITVLNITVRTRMNPTDDVIRDMFKLIKNSNVRSSDIEIACYLIAAGANVYALNSNGQTPLDIVKNPDMQAVMKGFRPPAECRFCTNTSEENVRLEPCNHAPACIHCSSYMKKCLVCKVLIQNRLIMKDTVVIPRSPKDVTKQIAQLETKIAEFETRQEGVACTICMDRPKTIVFKCGHSSCKVCASILWSCHICREIITIKFKII
ncbi:PREDICTED: E3 ubiquitin-protein ligase mib1-like [Nicrophorus vespilloides]|uniref:E3 ubiquitin-protein ligase mib1-like n=1 Tax=Nicrophorus vespilloides TaxID=110193 RepID=A0ABM1NI93_NICVS|nr:PREDICTED: E3 ubiquitin-protein ligase mib1-like [Nicrophorus vespilloides]